MIVDEHVVAADELALFALSSNASCSINEWCCIGGIAVLEDEFAGYEAALLFRVRAKARSVAIKRSIIGATILAGSGAG